MRVSLLLCGVLACACLVPALSAQDAVKVDPKHYSVVTENDQVRVLKVHYGPHEKSVMHSHPAAVAVFITDATVQFSYPDGKKDSHTVKAGDSQFTPAGVHLPENMGEKGMEVILVELKGKAAKANSMEKK
jgi:quercetin dioxygenase-like cupin family protein